LSEIAAALEGIDRQWSAELDKAFAAYYPDLKRVARARLRGSGLHGQVQTTALVHESYLKLSAGSGAVFEDRVRFLAYASRTLRSIIVDMIREERAQRRGGDLEIVTLDTAAQEGIADTVDVESVSAALDELAKLDTGLARLVEMRFFGGMTEPELAEALGVSVRTVGREWQKARALLLTLLGD
jgi:RNA polymerase sigma factor (TIGR02999 family)